MNRDETIEKHYRANYDKLVKRVINRVPNRSEAIAEECVQEAYYLAFKYFHTYNPNIKDFNSWFNTILNNATRLCKLKERVGAYAIDIEGMKDDLVVPEIDKDQVAIVLKGINESKERDREILTLFFVHGLKPQDVAEYTGKGRSNVRQIIFQFRRRLQSALS